jgi:hypothetical protein
LFATNFVAANELIIMSGLTNYLLTGALIVVGPLKKRELNALGKLLRQTSQQREALAKK